MIIVLIRFLLSPLGRRIVGAILLNTLGIGALGLTCPPAGIAVGVVALLLPTVLFCVQAIRSRF